MELLREGTFPLGRLHGLVAASGDDDDGGFLSVDEFDFAQVQLAFLADSVATSRAWAGPIADAGCVVIDHSGTFSADPDVPLVLPAINAADLAGYRERMLVACPSAATVQLLTAVRPLLASVGIDGIRATVLEPVSRDGQSGVQELARQSAQLLNAQAITPRLYPRQIAFNVLPVTDDLDAAGHSGPERTLELELRRLLGEAAPTLTSTFARVPVFFGAVQVLHLEMRDEITAEQAWNLLSTDPSVKVLDVQHGDDANPVAVSAADDAEVCIGRIRDDCVHLRGLELWVVADTVRRVAALTGRRIAEALVTEYL